MYNYYELLDIVKDSETRQIIADEMMDDYRKYYKDIKINKSTRENARKAYLNKKNISADETVKGTFCDGFSVFSDFSVPVPDDMKRQPIFEKSLKNWLKPENRKPVEFWIKDTIATARTMGWKPGKEYHVNIDGNLYDFNKVYELYMMIADSKENDGNNCELCDMGGKFKALMIKCKHGICVLLPINNILNWRYDVNCKRMFDTYKEIENDLINEAIKTA